MKIINNIYGQATSFRKDNQAFNENNTVKFSFGNISRTHMAENIITDRNQKLLYYFKLKYNYKETKPLQYVLKRILDCVGGAFGFVVTSPIILLSMFLIKTDSKGPAIFKQVRIGKDGNPFVIYKLRTMYVNPKNPGPSVTDVKDKRVTNIGKVLRKFSIDEFPQFLNIIKGDMSLVGPRPIVDLDLLLKNDPDSVIRLVVKPGATLNYRNQKYTNIKNKIKDEKDYVQNWSTKNDLMILAKIIKKVITGENY